MLSQLALCSGTIQGSGIGPLLFVLYINELAAILYEYKVTVKFFADDLKLYAEVSTDIDIQNCSSALNCISEWANAWQLVANLCSKVLYFTVKQKMLVTLL